MVVWWNYYYRDQFFLIYSPKVGWLALLTSLEMNGMQTTYVLTYLSHVCILGRIPQQPLWVHNRTSCNVRQAKRFAFLFFLRTSSYCGLVYAGNKAFFSPEIQVHSEKVAAGTSSCCMVYGTILLANYLRKGISAYSERDDSQVLKNSCFD